jgi:hypothetical protein
MFDHRKYKPFVTVDIKDRTWPTKSSLRLLGGAALIFVMAIRL